MSISNASSNASTSSTRPSESAPRSSMKVDSALMSFSSTSSCSLMIRFTSAVTSRPSAIFHLQGCASTPDAGPLLCVNWVAGGIPESLHVHAAVDPQRVAGHVGGLIRGQEHGGGRDLARRAGPAEWYRRGDLSFLFVVQAGGHVGVDEARRDRVHGDAARGVLAGQ